MVLVRRDKKRMESRDSLYNESLDKPIINNINSKTYREEAIEILNKLEEKGINIYDTNRKPGMYLKNNNDLIPNIFNSNELIITDDNNEKIIDDNELKNFWK